jgi:quercetin dioxygenase-like cupin family protein
MSVTHTLRAPSHGTIHWTRMIAVLVFAVVSIAFAVVSRAESAPAGQAMALAASDPSLKWGPCPPIFPKGCELTVLDGDPPKPNADALLRVPGGYEIPAHWHTSAERMILVTGKLQVTYKGQPAATLASGTYAYGPAKLAHKASCLSKEPCTLFIAFESAVDAHAHKGTLD